MDHISIVIVNYEADELTKKCLASLQNIKATNFKFQVVVVDNGSEKTFKLPKSLQSSFVAVIRSESNLGFTGGNNLGITYAIENYDSDYVCLLNNDTTVSPDFLTLLHQDLSKELPQGMISPKIYFSKGCEYHQKAYQKSDLGNIIWYAGGSIDWLNLISFHRGVDEIDRGQFDQLTASDYCTGACVLISREVLESVGLFDERLFLYFEDADLSVRAKKRGYKLLFCPQSMIWHDNAGSSGGAGSDLHQYYQTRNRIYFGLKHGKPRVKLTAIVFALRKIMMGNAIERKAAFHVLINNLGKEPYDKIR